MLAQASSEGAQGRDLGVEVGQLAAVKGGGFLGRHRPERVEAPLPARRVGPDFFQPKAHAQEQADQRHALHVGGREEAVAVLAALGRKQPQPVVMPQGPDAHARARRQFTDPHGGQAKA